MNRARLLTAAGGLTIALASVACNNDKITNLNKNPNSPETAPATTLFTEGARLSVARWMGGYSQRATEFVVQHMSEAQYSDEDRYTRLGPGGTEGYFTASYPGELEDLTKVVSLGKGTNEPGTWAPAQVMKVWGVSYVTNTFGDVPYSQAWQGDSVAVQSTAISPKYDAQKDIYTDLFAKLTEANTALGSASGTLGGSDPIYGGSTAKWQKFGNSLHARLALLLINVDPATAKAELAKALAGPLITTNADNAKVSWPGDGVYNNPWSDFFKTRDDNRMSKTLMDILIGNSDPRTSIYAQPTLADPTVYAGEPNGLSTPDAGQYLKTSSRIGTVMMPNATAYASYPGAAGAKWPSFLFTAAEMNFILAEVSERSLVPGYTPAQAAAYYNAGITASLNQWGVTDATTIANFLAQPNVIYQGGTAGQAQIATQKWIALFTDGGTAWFEWRRTCVPTTVTTTGAGTAFSNKYIPRRFQYSPTEYSVNDKNVAAAAAALSGGDTFNGIMYVDGGYKSAPTYNAAACNAP